MITIGLIAVAFVLLLWLAENERRDRRQEMGLSPDEPTPYALFLHERRARRIRTEARLGISETPLGHTRIGLDPPSHHETNAPARPESPGA